MSINQGHILRALVRLYIMISYLKKLKYFFQGKYISVKIIKLKKKWFGNNYGGFFINQDGLNESSVVYSIGIGEDISFDLELMGRFNCKIYAFDPTPKSITWVKKNVKNSNFIFSPIGISKEKGEKDFYLPKNEHHVSGSIHRINSVESQKKLKLNFDTLYNVMIKNNHKRIDVLKMDIEGAEYEVIESIKNYKIEIAQILVEFHPHFEKDGKKKTIDAINSLHEMGYKCFGRSNSFLEYSFIK